MSFSENILIGSWASWALLQVERGAVKEVVEDIM